MIDRALPGWAIDLCRDGVDVAQLRVRGGRAVYSALLRVAMSAQARGWDRIEWEALILDDPKSHLGSQVRTREGRIVPPKAINKVMGDAWDRAWANRTGTNPWTSDELAAEVAARAEHAVNVAADATNDLSIAARDVLVYAADEARRRGVTRVPLARRTVQDTLGLGERATRTALDVLVRTGRLVLVERGRPRGASATRKAKANLYELAPHEVSVNGPVGPPALTCGTPADEALGTPAFTCGTPDAEEQYMVTITRYPDGTLSVCAPSIPPEILAALQSAPRVEVVPADRGNVIPIRRTSA